MGRMLGTLHHVLAPLDEPRPYAVPPPAEAQASDGEQPATAEQPAAPDEGSLEQPAPDEGSLEPAAPLPGQQPASAQPSPAVGEEQAQ